MSGQLVIVLLWAIVLTIAIVVARWRRDGETAAHAGLARLLVFVLLGVGAVFIALMTFRGDLG